MTNFASLFFSRGEAVMYSCGRLQHGVREAGSRVGIFVRKKGAVFCAVFSRPRALSGSYELRPSRAGPMQC